MSRYPDVVLSRPVIVQPAITSAIFRVIQVAENPQERWVNAFISDGAKDFWITVSTPESYVSSWNDGDVTNAILDYVSRNCTPA
jgi:hypothetical protein